MSSKSNNRTRSEPSASSSSSQSPYNLRRNQLQPGAVTKRSSSTKPNKELSIIISQPVDQGKNRLVSQTTQNLSGSTSNKREGIKGVINTENSDFEELEGEGGENSATNSDFEELEGEDAENSATNSDFEEELEDEDGGGSSTNSDFEEQLKDDDGSSTPNSDLEEQLEGDDDGSIIECSDEEEEALAYMQHVERKEKKPPSVRQHFERLAPNVYLCTYCRKSIKTYNGTDTNLRSHLGRAHQMSGVMYKSQLQQREPKLNQIKSERKQELDTAAIECIITDARSFGDFRRTGMVNFLKVICPGYTGPSRKTVRKRLGLTYHEYRAELRTVLASITSIAITVDIWTKRQTSFICLTGHLFNNQYQSIPIVLSFRHLVGSHRADNIKKYIMYEFQQLQIQDKVCAVVSDNGADIVKAINDIMPGKRYSCLAHDINRVVKVGLKLWDSKKKKERVGQTTTDSHETDTDISNDDGSESDATDVPEELEEEDENDYSVADANKTQNGSADVDTDDHSDYYMGSEDEENDVEKQNQEMSEENLIEPEHIQQFARALLKRIRACIKNIRNTRVVYNYVQRQAQLRQPPIKCSLVNDMKIRWNTTFIMLDRFVSYQFIIHEINRQPSKVVNASQEQQMKLSSKNFEFSNNNWRQIADLRTVLKPFCVATAIISAKNYPTLACANSVQFALSHFLITTEAKDSSLLHLFKSCLIQSYQLYFNKKMAQHQKNNSLIAAFLDPKGYKRLQKRPAEFQQALGLLKTEMKKETPRTADASNITHSQKVTTSNSSIMISSSSTITKRNTIETLFSLCGVGSSSSTSCLSTRNSWSIDEEIGYYMSSVNGGEKLNFATFWTEQGKRLPLMSVIVRRVSIIPATSVPCESTFSVAVYIQRKQRSSLSPRALCYSLLLKDRHKLALLKDSIQQ